MQLGDYHVLRIARETDFGMFLENEDGEEVLLPNKYVPQDAKIDENIEVFVYLDHEERPVATTLKPKIKLDDFALLECVAVSKFGAFLDWGLEKHLFVPFKEQVVPMENGRKYLVFCYLDLETNRLAASSKVHAFLSNEELTVEPFEEVDLIVTNETELGFNVIINKLHLGLIYHDDVFQPMKFGEELKGVVKKIRPDHKIDVTLQRPGYRSIEPNADKIMEELQKNGGRLPVSDKSSPEDIQQLLHMSKKSFKKAAGTLYKKRLIVIKENEIVLK